MKIEEKTKAILDELDSLNHYGVLGMKWGRKRGRSDDQNGSIRRKKDSKKLKKAEVKQMSDSELRQRLNRLQMEKQYSQLTKREKTAGEKLVGEILVNSAKQTASNYVSKYMVKGIEQVVKKVKE